VNAEELAALPVGSIILVARDLPYRKTPTGWRYLEPQMTFREGMTDAGVLGGDNPHHLAVDVLHTSANAHPETEPK
jgi:hypothetical protein